LICKYHIKKKKKKKKLKKKKKKKKKKKRPCPKERWLSTWPIRITHYIC
jgi:hypothetical protein